MNYVRSANLDLSWLPRHRLDIADLDRMVAAGILREDDRVELIDGELIVMAPQGQEHSGIILDLTTMLVRAAGDRAVVSCQLPVRLDSFNQPEPDFALLRPPVTRYRIRRALPEDILVAIEIAASSLRYDREVKRQLYAVYGIAEYWVIDVHGKTVEVCRLPEGDRYTSVTLARSGETIEPQALPGLRLSVSDIVG